MHRNKAYRGPSPDENLSFARTRGFGTLCLNHDDGPLLSHIPFVLSADGTYAEAHLVRSNPILKLLGPPKPAVIAVSGGDSYVSPDWYGLENQVPTWNYVAVHLRGTLRQLPAEDLRGILERLSDQFEQRLLPKKVWTLDKVADDAYRKLSMQIVPIRLDIDDVQGTWKLAQPKPPEAIAGAADGIADVTADGLGLGVDRIVRLMRDL